MLYQYSKTSALSAAHGICSDLFPSAFQFHSPTMPTKEALAEFIQQPISRDMVNYLALKAKEVIRCESHVEDVPTPPSTPPQASGSDSDSDSESTLPPLEVFISSIIERSHVQVSTLMTSLVYLARLRKRLPPVAKGMKCTVHRIFLASLILSAKNLNDSSPKNKHWARYTCVKGYEGFGFSLTEVNLMEKQLLFLLDWDLNLTENDLFEHFDFFLVPIHKRQLESRPREQNLVVAPEQNISNGIQTTTKDERSLRNTSIYQTVHRHNKTINPAPTPTPPRTPARETRSRSVSRSRAPSASVSQRNCTERSRSRSTQRGPSYYPGSLACEDSPPPSSQIPELYRSGTSLSMYSDESSPVLPSPSAVYQVHCLVDTDKLSPKATGGKPTKKRTNMFSRWLSGEKTRTPHIRP